MNSSSIAILGAGPAGLGAAWQLRRRNKAEVVVFEQRDAVGGNAGSFLVDGIPVDYGSHRLHPACRPDILDDLRGLLDGDLLDRPRHGRILLHGRWIHFPLKPLDVLLASPWSFKTGVARDAVRKLFPRSRDESEPQSFASILEHGLGPTICRDFYFPYAVKIWGRRPAELSAIQARRRVAAGSLAKMMRKILSAVPGLRPPGAGRFFYPRRGYGQISQAIAAAAAECGASLKLQTRVRSIRLGPRHQVEFEHNGVVEALDADHVWSTIPITLLPRLVAPAAPAEVQEAAGRIEFRAMILVYLVLEQPQFTPFDAHYLPGPDIPFTRISEPKNYAARTEPADRTILCGELPCATNDPVWSAPDDELGGLLRDALARCGLPVGSRTLKVVIRRLSHAYPIYTTGYEQDFDRIDRWAAGLDRVLTFGRQGLFAHDNTHHALAMAYAAVDCLDAAGSFNAARWRDHRQEFATHVVED